MNDTVVDDVADLLGITTATLNSNVNLSNAAAVHNYSHQQYEAVAAGETTQGQALYDIISYAELINGGDRDQALHQVALSIVGDDVIDNGGGFLFINGRGDVDVDVDVTGAEGFRFSYAYGQQNSNQISHAVAGLFIAHENGNLGTAGVAFF